MLEVTGGLNYSKQIVYHMTQTDLDAVQRSIVPGFQQFFPQANPQNLIPNITVAGTQRAAEHPRVRRLRAIGTRSTRPIRRGTSRPT